MNIFQEQTVYSLGWALVHFLWQGALIGLALKLVLTGVGARSARSRYAAGCAGLILLAAAPLVTFLVLKSLPAGENAPTGIADQKWQGPGVIANAAAHRGDAPSSLEVSPMPGGLREGVDKFMPLLAAFWSCGVLFLSVRLLVGWWKTSRLRTGGTTEVGPSTLHRFREASRGLGLKRGVALLESAWVTVPTTLGWLRPVVLLPTLYSAGPGRDRAALDGRSTVAGISGSQGCGKRAHP